MKKREGKEKVIVILGPTATGKSDLAVIIAKKYNGEVISADSRQVYKDLTIGTGKITKKEMRRVQHHLLDVADPKKTYSAAHFVEDAEEALREIKKKGKVPIICGGTGFYIDALLGNLSIPHVPANKKLRKGLSQKSNDELVAALALLDRRRVKTIDRKNRVRLIRAIEVALALGEVPETEKKEKYETLKIGLRLPNNTLKEKIEKRLRTRLQSGMVAEAKQLHAKGLSWKRMEELGLEYRYLAKYLNKKITKEEMIKKLNLEIWRYAKRQMTWFKRDKSIRWIAPTETKRAERLIKKFLR